MDIKVRVECYEAYCLNSLRNFLEQDYLEIDDTDELIDTAAYLLKEHGCPDSAVFIHCFDETMFAVLNDESEDHVEVAVCEKTNMEFFKTIDAECRLCCYTLWIEKSPGVFEIIVR